MPLVNIIDMVKDLDIIVFLFGAFGFYGLMLCIQLLVLGKRM